MATDHRPERRTLPQPLDGNAPGHQRRQIRPPGVSASTGGGVQQVQGAVMPIHSSAACAGRPGIGPVQVAAGRASIDHTPPIVRDSHNIVPRGGVGELPRECPGLRRGHHKTHPVLSDTRHRRGFQVRTAPTTSHNFFGGGPVDNGFERDPEMGVVSIVIEEETFTSIHLNLKPYGRTIILFIHLPLLIVHL